VLKRGRGGVNVSRTEDLDLNTAGIIVDRFSQSAADGDGHGASVPE
jgi:hypothetical protein